MNILAIETGTDACTCALLHTGEIIALDAVAPRQHAELLLQMIDSVLEDVGVGLGSLDAIAFGRGPGSFTGLRIACAVAQGLAFGANRPLVAVSTLQTVATGMHRTTGAHRVLVAFDARMGEVYWGASNGTASRWRRSSTSPSLHRTRFPFQPGTDGRRPVPAGARTEPTSKDVSPDISRTGRP